MGAPRRRTSTWRVCARRADTLPGVRIAVGPTATGIEGFRRSHLDALTTQRMLARLGSRQRVALFADVELVALITQDPDRADEFIKHTLGDFESASAELHTTVRTFVAEQCNASRAAARLYTHRNTLLRRLARADQLLPQPLQDNGVHVAVALEALHWRGVEHTSAPVQRRTGADVVVSCQAGAAPNTRCRSGFICSNW